ncbi:hypothetical protein SAMN05421874_11012 [Nonomuraea maritima]|uniref:Integral membrane protein n=1 Tax=Nonomuraea maritima TaxID=683260 RepID=A0A1G9DV37_9ACTN|nr:hypothetical protein [Nonomuraea maritima]SDK67702.1 hypothetical protein SAMN05421874_11012 [Nonomuraea maritima]
MINMAVQAEKMPAILAATRFVVVVQLAFGLFGAAIMTPLFMGAFSHPALLVLLMPYVVVLVCMGLLVFRWSSRQKWVRWGGIAFEGVMVGYHLVMAVVHAEFGWMTLVHPSTVLPAAIVIGLLTPSAVRWFVR